MSKLLPRSPVVAPADAAGAAVPSSTDVVAAAPPADGVTARAGCSCCCVACCCCTCCAVPSSGDAVSGAGVLLARDIQLPACCPPPAPPASMIAPTRAPPITGRGPLLMPRPYVLLAPPLELLLALLQPVSAPPPLTD